MIENKKSSNEFEARIGDDGKIAVPDELRKSLAGKRLHVRLYSEEVSAPLRSRGVTEEEIDHIADAQLEAREQVVKFLSSEGSLAGNTAFIRRSGKRLTA